MKDGTDPTRATGERYLSVVLPVNWVSNGATLTLMAPANSTTTANYITAPGMAQFQANQAQNVLSVTGSNTVPGGQQTQLKTAISNLFNTTNAMSNALTAVNVLRSYTYEIDFGSFPLTDANGNPFTKIQGTFMVQ